jgi:hypothetical protein
LFVVVAVFNRPEDDSGVNIEDQIVTQGASESVSGSGSTQSSATEDQHKSGLKKTSLIPNIRQQK